MSCSPPSSAEQPNPTSPSATPSYEPVGIFWDYENCAPSTNSSGYNIVDNIRALANQYGAANVFKAYLQLPEKSSAKQSSLRSELQSCGLSLTDCPHNGKNSVDLMMIVDIMAFIKDNSPPATIILISGDRDFAYLLSTIRWRKYNVVLISNTFMTHESLTAQASVVYDWKSDILKTRPPSKLPPVRPRPETLPSVGSPSAPQEPDNPLVSDVRAAGPPNEQTISAVNPLALPPEAPFVKLETAPIPLKTEIPTEAAPAGILMTPTSDDRIAAVLTSESAMVQPSLNTINLVDEGDVHSPVFSRSEMTPFIDLILVLDDLSANGNSRPQFSTVFSLLRDRKPDMVEAVDATKFKVYLQLAESTGIVAVEHHQDGDGCVTLRHQPNTSSDGPSQHAQSHHAGSRFRDLTGVLNDLRPTEDLEHRFSAITKPLRKNPSVHKDAGVTRFKDHVEPGLVTPPSRTASTPPPFAPLVDFLKSKRSTNAQPVPFSDIFAHFISTLGHPEMVSLCTSIPGVSTFGQYIDAAIASGLISLISGTTASRDALISLRDTKSSLSVRPQFSVPVKTRTTQHGPFEPLIRTLTKLWHEGKREPAFSEVHPLLLAQDIMAYDRAGAVTIEDYVTKAAAANLVIYDSLAAFGIFSMCTTVRLREPPRLPEDQSPPTQLRNFSTTLLPSFPPKEITVLPPPTNVTSNPFQDLIVVLTKLRESMGESEFRFSSVVSWLLTRRPDAYASVGVTNFVDYMALAMKNGVVRIRWAGRDGWVSLVTQGPKD